MSTETATSIAALNIGRGVCLQDFETTLQPDVDEIHLCGLLNMSVLWNKLSFIYDTAVGDNPHLIVAFLKPAEHRLYRNFQTYVKEGAVSCLVRDKITLPGKGIVEHSPGMSGISASWFERDGNRRDRFLTRIFGPDRDRYNRNIDKEVFDGPGQPVTWYDPDKSKPFFRSLIRKGLSDGGDVIRELRMLPQEIQTAYRRICDEKEYFTTADIWEVVKNLEAARPLIAVQGYINQQALADSLTVGSSGADWGHRWRPDVWHSEPSTPTEEPASLEELAENADIQLLIPTLQLVGMLKPEDVLELRKNAPYEIEVTDVENEVLTKIEVQKRIEEYWRLICLTIEKRFYAQAKEKVQLYGWLCDHLPFRRVMNSSDFVKQVVEIVVAQEGGGVAVRVLRLFKTWFLYEDTELMRQTRRIESRVWSPESQWSVQPVVQKSSSS